MKRFWISWQQLSFDYRPLQDPPQPENIKAWWCSGEGHNYFNICAIIDAEDEKKAIDCIYIGWQEEAKRQVGSFRFIEEQDINWLPNNRFPITKNWEKERLGVNNEN